MVTYYHSGVSLFCISPGKICIQYVLFHYIITIVFDYRQSSYLYRCVSIARVGNSVNMYILSTNF